MHRFARHWMVGLVVGLFLVAGCDWVRRSPPETARLRLEGAPDVEVQLITSTRFAVGTRGLEGGRRVSFVQADTTTVTLPFEQTYDIEDDQRFVARVVRPHLETDDLVMQGWVDGDPKYNQTGSPALPDSVLQFIYVFMNNTRVPGKPAL